MSIDLVAEQSALGGLERWLYDPTVSEVVVNGRGDVWAERGGGLQRVGTMSERAVQQAIEQILRPLGRRIDRVSPTVDARLADGSRLCAVLPPVSVDGPCLAVRRFAIRRRPLDAFATGPVLHRLERMVRERRNVIVSGATSSGKTSLLNSMAALVPATERIITLEDTAELDLDHPHVLRLEARPATPDGAGAVDLAELLRTALRLRPDRLVVGEVRGAEAAVLIQAMNTGHDGSLTTVHANSAGDAMARVASLVVQHVPAWPLAAIELQLARSVQAVVHVGRGDGGTRQVEAIHEVATDGAQWSMERVA